MSKDMEALAFIGDPCPAELVEKIQKQALRAYRREIDANCPADMVPSSPELVNEAVERGGKPCRLIGVRFRYEKPEREAL